MFFLFFELLKAKIFGPFKRVPELFAGHVFLVPICDGHLKHEKIRAGLDPQGKYIPPSIVRRDRASNSRSRQCNWAVELIVAFVELT